MNYRQKRNNARISAYTMAKELGVSKEKYLKLEKNGISLENELLDKFNYVINNAKEINLNRMARLQEINEWYKSGKGLEKLKMMGYNYNSIAYEIGQKGSGNICKIFKGKEDSPNYDLKEEVYDFLNNPLNKNLNPELQKTRSREKKETVPFNEVEGIEVPTTEEVVKDIKKVEEFEKEESASSVIINADSIQLFTGENADFISKLEKAN